MHTKIRELLELAVNNKASDIHLAVGMWPKIRVHGELMEVTGMEGVDEVMMEEMILSTLSEGQKEKVLREKEFDYSLSWGSSRFRVNTYYQKGRLASAMRIVPSQIPTLAELRLPEICSSFAALQQGFVLITGPTGQGKSTTVASILAEINQNRSCHIVTIEDPVEYVIEAKKALVSQREVISDTISFSTALRSCLRQDPNVVFVGEMRDLETIALALTVAETGHLVFSTLHTNSAAQSIDRIIDVFPEGSKEQIRLQLSNVISAIVSQRLLPAVGGGRIPAVEVLVATPAVKNAIRENKTHMIDNIIQTSADVGMIGLEASLAALVKENKISEENALSYSLRPGELQSRLREYKLK